MLIFELKYKIALFIDRIFKKVRYNPTCKSLYINKWRNLINHKNDINLNECSDFFSKYPNTVIDYTKLESDIDKATTQLESLKSAAAQKPSTTNEIPKIVWMFWDKGLDNAPDVVKLSVESWKHFNPDYEIRVLDDVSINNYLSPKQIFKISSVDLTIAHKSDYIRTYLLSVYGGVWTDSTTFCWKPLDEWLPDFTNTTGFFVFHQNSSRQDRQIKNWFLASSAGNPIMKSMLAALTSYIFKPRSVVLTLRKPRHYMHLSGISRVDTGYNLLTTLENRNTYPYFFYHYLFNEVVKQGEAQRLWSKIRSSKTLEHSYDPNDQYYQLISKESYKKNHINNSGYIARKEKLNRLISTKST